MEDHALQKIMLFIGTLQFLTAILSGFYAALTGFSGLAITSPAIFCWAAFTGWIILYSFVYWPTYVVGLILIFWATAKLITPKEQTVRYPADDETETEVVHKVLDIRFATKLLKKHADRMSPGAITVPSKPRKMFGVQSCGMGGKEIEPTMSNFIPIPTIPALSAIVYSIIGIAETIMGSDEKFRRFIPLTACVMGVICGIFAFYLVPSVMDTQNFLVELILGAFSGLSASHTYQVVM